MTLDVTISADTRGTRGFLTDVERKQLPFATALALTRSAYRANKDWQAGGAERAIDRPTRWAKGYFSVVKATKHNHRAELVPKDFRAKKDFLSAQAYGGARVQKAFERWVSARIGEKVWIVPGPAAKIDRYGNIAGSMIAKVLSELRASPDAHQWATGSKRSRRSRGGFFVLRKNGTAIGVAQRSGRGLDLVMVFLRAAPVYRQNAAIYGEVSRSARRAFPEEFDKALRDAVEHSTYRSSKGGQWRR